MENGSASDGHKMLTPSEEPTTEPGRYTPKNILVTGGAGFIASHVVILLVEKYPNYKVVNLDRLDYCSCLENLDSLKGKPNYKVAVLELLDLEDDEETDGDGPHTRLTRTLGLGSDYKQSPWANMLRNQDLLDPTSRTAELFRRRFRVPHLFFLTLVGRVIEEGWFPTAEVGVAGRPCTPVTLKFVKGNICSSDLMMYVLREEKIDTILHFAAQTHVDNSFGNSFQFTQNNIYGTHVLLESAKKVGIKRFVHVSTDEVYGEGEHDQEPMFEDHVLEPTNPYAATKAGAEFIAKAYFRSFNLPVVITRGNNVYGPHQYPEKLVPKFINQLMRGKKLTIHGTGENTRNFLYVKDVATAFDEILHKAVEGHIYNIGGSNEVSVLQVAKDLMRVFGKECKDERELTEFGEDRVFNDLRYTINNDKLLKLGWTEETSWEDGLAETVEWYRTHSSRFGDIEHCLVAHPRAGLGLDVADAWSNPGEDPK